MIQTRFSCTFGRRDESRSLIVKTLPQFGLLQNDIAILPHHTTRDIIDKCDVINGEKSQRDKPLYVFPVPIRILSSILNGGIDQQHQFLGRMKADVIEGTSFSQCQLAQISHFKYVFFFEML